MTDRLAKPARLWQLFPDGDTATDRLTTGPPDIAGAWRVEDPSDVAFLSPYSFVVADSVGHRLLLVDIARNVCSVVADRQVWPNGVDVTADGKLLVTDRLTKVLYATTFTMTSLTKKFEGILMGLKLGWMVFASRRISKTVKDRA